jgi:hypothetical protein
LCQILSIQFYFKLRVFLRRLQWMPAAQAQRRSFSGNRDLQSGARLAQSGAADMLAIAA